MDNAIVLVLMYFFEWFIVYHYAKSVYEKRSKISVLITVLLYTVLMFLYTLFPTVEGLNMLCTALCIFLCIFVGFRSTLKSALFRSVILTITQAVSELVAIYTVSFLSGTSNVSYWENEFIFISDVIISKILYFALSNLLIKNSNRENSAKSWGRWVALAVLPISSLIILLVIRVFSNGKIFTFEDSMLCIISMSLLLVANVVVYLIYEKAEESNQKLIELELINRKNNTDMQYLSLIEKKNERMQIMSHDFKKKALLISNMTDSEEIKEYINGFLGEIKQYNHIAKTRNKILDVILNKYTDICDDNNISFHIEAYSDNLSFIDSYDISSMFNNILDNAVEAAVLSEKKYIDLEIARCFNDYHKIVVVNSSDIAPISENGRLLTTKSNKQTHGFGTKIILNTVDKYDGEMQWNYNPDLKEFKLIILIPPEEYIEKFKRNEDNC